MKHYIDIENARLEDVDLGNDVIRRNNIGTFEVGDHIVIQEKVDGSNASFTYEDGKLVAFSRKTELSYNNTLRGFWNFVQSLDAEEYEEDSQYIFFGEWTCLSGDTVIRKTSAGKNTLYMTLRDMYKFLHTPSTDKFHFNINKGYVKIVKSVQEGNITERDIINDYKKVNNIKDYSVNTWITKTINKGYIFKDNNDIFHVSDLGMQFYHETLNGKNSWWHRYGMPSIFSLDINENKIIPNQIKTIVYTGDKEVYRVTTRKGLSIKATGEHRFYTPHGFKELKTLKEKDCVAISYLHKQYRVGRSYGAGIFEVLKAQASYKKRIGKCEECGSTYKLELHHIDHNYRNNDESNWKLLCKKCHQDIHKADDRFNDPEYDYEYDYITSIEYVGIEDCYDIEMCGDENIANFVADGFIVHNCKNKIVYNPEWVGKFLFYDIWDKENECYMPKDFVKEQCKKHNLEYIHELYNGPFVSWEHCKTFLNNPAYGDRQEGIVCKNQSKLNNPNSRIPFYLKIVNDDFKESMAQKTGKIIDLQKDEERKNAEELMKQIVTQNRVEKMIYKMTDEGILPQNITPKDMKIVAKNLPKMIYEDCVKEEPEIVQAAGEFGGKICSSLTMQFARQMLLG